MKRVIYTLLCLLILLVPVGVSFLSWQDGQNTPLNAETLVDVTLTYPNGQIRQLQGDTEDPAEQTDISTLLTLVAPAITEEHQLPALNFKDVYTYSELTFTTRYYSKAFRLYVSTQDAVMTIAGENGYFAVPADVAKGFLSNPMARPYYDAPALPAPVLGDTALPLTENTLAIRTAGGPLTLADRAEPLSTPISLTTPNLSLPDDLPTPSSLTVSLTAGEDTLFSQSGTPEELETAFAALKLTRTGAAKLTITAVYNEVITRPWYGTVVWEAPISLDVVPLASLVQTEVLAGTPVQLTINQPNDLSTLTVYTEWLDRTFTAEELSVTANGYSILLPTPLRVENVTTCRVIVSADGVAWDPLTITVSPRQATDEVQFVWSEDNSFSMSFALGGEDRYNAHLATLAAHYNSEPCKRNLSKLAPLTLISPLSTNGDFVTICEAGQVLSVTASTYTFSHTSQGTWFFTTLTDDADLLRVYAVADGTVLATGETDYGGHYVVVDHGGGLCSTYFNLSAASTLQIGTQVRAGDVLGHCGTSGMTRTDTDCANVTVQLTLHGKPIAF